MARLICSIVLACFATLTIGQSIIITGKVLDDDTGEGVPFCNVYFKGTTTGVSTDIDGSYELSSENFTDTLVVSAIGYDETTRLLNDQAIQVVNFRLKSADFTLDEVVVIAGENPANLIVKNIIEHKEDHQLNNFDAYQCEEYSKIELDLENLNPKMLDNKLFKPFKFIFENVDSTSDEKPFLPAFITETISDIYYVKEEGKVKTIPQAQRISGVNDRTLMDLVGKVSTSHSIYDNWIYIMNKPFVSPFSNQGLAYYEYYILDSTFIQNQWSYKLKFKPKRKQDNTFYGDFWVVDTTFAIQRVNMRMTPDANLNLVSRVIIYEEFEWHNDSYWLPAKQQLIIDFTATPKAPGLIGRKTSSFKNYRIESEDIVSAFQKKSNIDYYVGDLEKDNDYWKTARHEALSANETKIYAMVDSIKNVPVYKTYVDVLFTLTTGYKVLGPIEIGPYFSMYNNNIVEGHRFRMGAWTSNSFSKKIRFGGYLAYGLKDETFKYGADVQVNLKKYPRTIIGGAIRNDLDVNSDSSEEIGEGNLFSGFYRRPIVQKLMNIQEGKLFYERYWRKGWSSRLTLLHRHMDPYGGLEQNGDGFNYKFLPNPESLSVIDTTVTSTELIFKTRFAFGEKFLDGAFFRTSLGTKYPIVEFQYTAGMKGVLGSDYGYHKFALGISHYFYLNPIGWTAYQVKFGKIVGTLPFLLLETHPGNETYFYSKHNFNGMNRYEFVSDSYASLFVEHHFDGFILNKVPLIRKLKWRTVATFKSVIGSMTTANQQANQLNQYTPSDNLDNYTGFRSPSKTPYMETGIGIENIFKIIRIDALWRLSYLDNPEVQKFSFRAGLEFYF